MSVGPAWPTAGAGEAVERATGAGRAGSAGLPLPLHRNTARRRLQRGCRAGPPFRCTLSPLPGLQAVGIGEGLQWTRGPARKLHGSRPRGIWCKTTAHHPSSTHLHLLRLHGLPPENCRRPCLPCLACPPSLQTRQSRPPPPPPRHTGRPPCPRRRWRSGSAGRGGRCRWRRRCRDLQAGGRGRKQGSRCVSLSIPRPRE